MAGAAAAQEKPALVYGVETDARGARERVLVFSSEPREAKISEGRDGQLTLVVPNALLDPSAPTLLRPSGRGAVREIQVKEARTAKASEVRVTIKRRKRLPYELESRGATVSVSFERAQAPPEDGVTLAYENAALREIVERVAKETGERFIFDEKLAARASIVAITPVPRESLMTLLHSVLHVAGFSAVRSPSGAHRIVPVADAASSAEVTRELRARRGDAPVTLAIPLRAAEASDVASRIGPYAGKKAIVVAESWSNTLFVTGSESHVRTLLELIQAFDGGAADEFWIRRTRHRDVLDVEAQLRAALADGPGPQSQAVISVDERGQLLVVVAPADELETIRGLVDQLDVRPDSAGEIHVYGTRHADPAALAEVLNAVSQGGANGGVQGSARARALAGLSFRAVVDQPTGSLVIRADEATYRGVAELLDELDRPVPQIEVEVTLLEVLTSDDLSLGFDTFVPVGAGNSRTGGSGFLNPSGGGLFQPGTGGGRDFAIRYTRSPIEVPVLDDMGNTILVLIPRESFVATADNSFVATRVTQRPHLLILPGDEQTIFAGDNVPVPVAADGARNEPLTTRLNVERYDVGVTMRVTARLGLSGRIELGFQIESSRLGSRALVGAVENAGPVIEERTLTTSVWLGDAEPALLGGAEVSESTLEEVGTPWLRDIPLLGHLFKTIGDRSVKSHLVIAAQAHVHRDPSDDIEATIRRRLGFERALARREGIDVGSEPAWGIRVTTRTRRDDATALAEHFDALEGSAQVSTWKAPAGERHDVVLTGFDDLDALAEVAEQVRSEGFTPELIPVPAREE